MSNDEIAYEFAANIMEKVMQKLDIDEAKQDMFEVRKEMLKFLFLSAIIIFLLKAFILYLHCQPFLNWRYSHNILG